jgi:hypothetical protein
LDGWTTDGIGDDTKGDIFASRQREDDVSPTRRYKEDVQPENCGLPTL